MDFNSEKNIKAFDFVYEMRAKNSQTLLQNANISIMSSKLGINRKKLERIIRDMYESKIGCLRIVINYHALGLSSFLFQVKPKDTRDTYKIMDELSGIVGIFPTYLVANKGMILVCKAFVNPQRLDSLLAEINSKLEDKIDPITVIGVKKVYAEEATPFGTDIQSIYKIDEKDCIILSELIKNGFTTLKQISEKTKLSEPSIHARIIKLKKKNVILGYTFFYDWEYAPTKVTSMRTEVTGKLDSRNVPDLFRWFEENQKYRKYLRYFYETYGEMNINFTIVIPGPMELKDFTRDLTEKFNFIKLEVAPLIYIKWNKNFFRWDSEAPFEKLVKDS